MGAAVSVEVEVRREDALMEGRGEAMVDMLVAFHPQITHA